MSLYGFSQANDVKDLDLLRQSIEQGTLEPKYKSALKLDCGGQAILNYISLRRDGRQAALQVFGGDCADRLVFFFEQRNGNWSQVANVRLSARYGKQPEVSFIELTEPGVQDLMVQHQVVDWGTGIEQKNMTIYKWVGDRFEVAFDQPEMVHVSVPATGRHGTQINYQFDQQSTFEVATGEVPSDKRLIERQSIRKKDLTLSHTRNWIWDPELRRFRSFETAPPAAFR